jgi:hypothetical protein
VLVLWNSEVSREYTDYVSHTTDVLKTLYLHMESLGNVQARLHLHDDNAIYKQLPFL